MYTLSDTIRARRKEMGLTLEDLAGVVGVTPGALSHIESGRRLPDPRNAVAIATALHIDPDGLLTLLDEAHADRRASQVGRSRPRERTLNARLQANLTETSAVFRPMPIDALFSEPEDTEGDTAAVVHSGAEAVLDHDPHASVHSPRSNVSASSPRDRARYSSTAGERLHAAEELAEDALRAIRTLRGMLEDEDPTVAREAKRLLRELDVRGAEE